MAYDAVYLCADFDSSTYDEYQLTQQAVRYGDDEIEKEISKYERTEADEWDEIVIDDENDSGGRPIDRTT